ncbi:hypothetical protein [Actinomadura madurae]|uniref:hypothetical protein n=1 Tax=Actinomadura madurae TaxID=1993 RepID=UPI0020D1F941|nr:hypothetical protein [Actinomadura madurae]MCP9955054.1 hypothetical protein [Actinomadura madurae]MCP9984291.1 hypothetical protein [Actinomadura madurae]
MYTGATRAIPPTAGVRPAIATGRAAGLPQQDAARAEPPVDHRRVHLAVLADVPVERREPVQHQVAVGVPRDARGAARRRVGGLQLPQPVEALPHHHP